MKKMNLQPIRCRANKLTEFTSLKNLKNIDADYSGAALT